MDETDEEDVDIGDDFNVDDLSEEEASVEFEDDEIEEETIIVRKKVVKPGKKKVKNIVSLR